MQLYFIQSIVESLPCMVTLATEESFHCIKVLRKRKGDTLYLTDGNGNLFTAIIENSDVKNCMLKVLSVQNEVGKRSFYLHLAVAPTKNIARFEWFLEKATEIGVDEITPIFCEHSERVQIKTERLKKIILSATKQSLKTYLPKLNEATQFFDFIKNTNLKNRFVAYVDSLHTIPLKSAYKSGDCCLLIGPEGDFSKNEIELAINHQFIPVGLGNSRLRTETAAIVACHTLNFIHE